MPTNYGPVPDARLTPFIEPRFSPQTNHAPFRVKVSSDFGAVSTEINTAAAAGAELVGTSRAASAIPVQGGLLLNANLAPTEGELNVEVQFTAGGPWVRYRPLAVWAAGGVGYVLVPHGYGHPTGFLNWRAVWVAINAAASVVVTSQPYAW